MATDHASNASCEWSQPEYEDISISDDHGGRNRPRAIERRTEHGILAPEDSYGL
jgi:hypothetical protein